jgi:hypothetical protein
MRITGPNGPSATTSKSSVKRSASGTFTLPQDEESTAAPSGTSGVSTLAGIDALIALQGVESGTERRRKAVGRGKSALDALDALKIALLSGTLDLTSAERLRTLAIGLQESSGDPALDQVLAEIELRVQVELAKIQVSSE